eukprot:SM000070S21290  [mRNA]  locus=s70:78216:81597:- [translate_table: standard]
MLCGAGQRCGGYPVRRTEPKRDYLNVELNKFSGPLPPELGKLKRLKFFAAAANQLSSSQSTQNLPPSRLSHFNTSAALDNISLWSCLPGAGRHECHPPPTFSGPIPPELGNCTNLVYLYLDPNRLTGTIPPELGNLVNVTNLYVNHNLLTGPIPPELDGLKQLQVLSGGFNRLTANIPPELGRTNLTKIFLSNNSLNGNIPPALGGLANLNMLVVSVNSLSGGIPPELGRLSKLQQLDISTNELTGRIPVELGTLSENLNILILSNNRLEGSIPPELGNCSDLEQLKLTSNNLTGAIPGTLGHLNNLKILDLSSNSIAEYRCGLEPRHMMHAMECLLIQTVASLPRCSLTGSIPPELGRLTNLDRLFLFNNRQIWLFSTCCFLASSPSPYAWQLAYSFSAADLMYYCIKATQVNAKNLCSYSCEQGGCAELVTRLLQLEWPDPQYTGQLFAAL